MTRIAISGGGIGGLTAALALADIGCEVDVFEQSDAFSEVGAGIQLAPNACRVLHELNVLPLLAGLAIEPTALEILDGHSRKQLAQMPLGAIAEKRWGAPTLVVHRADLQQALLQAAATRKGVRVHTGATIADPIIQTDRITLETPSIGSMDFDALIGAEGLNSALRSKLFAAPKPEFSHRIAWRNVVPVEMVPAFAKANKTSLWLGSHAHLVHYPVRGGTLVNVVAITVWHGDASDVTGSNFWDQQIAIDNLYQHFGFWHEDALSLLSSDDNWRCWPLMDSAPNFQWNMGRVALLGDAAHPTLPFMAQGSAQAIEDAAALACLIAAQRTDIPAALARYSQLRAPRAARVQALSRQQGQIYHLSGIAAFARNSVMRMMSPEHLAARTDWIYGHDATKC
ncbi:MAG: FAD-dependent monooxygenase [Hyphomicrobiales bacterium]|nr:FAD-dependent monooxygenase [Hyphomicrobiales bacterium]MDE2115738.1 FAD-dependent monooxygenase [Hyphomicrobiales bacterium]